MNRGLAIALITLGLVAGFLVGRATSDGSRSGRVANGGRADGRTIEMTADEAIELRRRASEFEELSSDKVALEEELRGLKKQLEPKPGDRLADGRIVGGARWGGGFKQLAAGFLDSMLSIFMKNADFTPAQERAFRALVDKEIDVALAVTADFTNGDIDADTAYERLQAEYDDAMTQLSGMLSEKQMGVYRSFEKGVASIMQHQVVHNELAALKKDVHLDLEQEKAIRKVIEERYQRVADNFPMPVPNVLLKPIRRTTDQPIYDETAAAISKILRPDQQAAYAAFEAQAGARPYEHRNMLVPKKSN
ncbi:MAG: hypothetical protein ACYTGN_05405 [Planctomycetota bacterium]|jgi:hypothetical protein